MENNMYGSTPGTVEADVSKVDLDPDGSSTPKRIEPEMDRGSFSSIITIIIVTIILNSAVTVSMLYYYDIRYATKIVCFDFTRFKNTLVDEIITGHITQEESEAVVDNLKIELSNLTKDTNTLILRREVVVDGDIEEIDPGVQWLQK